MILLKRGLLTQATPPPPRPAPPVPPPPPAFPPLSPPTPPPPGKRLTLPTHAERSTPLNLRKPFDLSIGHVTFLPLNLLVLPHLSLFAWFLDPRQEAACRTRHRHAPPPEACCSHNTAVLWKNREQTNIANAVEAAVGSIAFLKPQSKQFQAQHLRFTFFFFFFFFFQTVPVQREKKATLLGVIRRFYSGLSQSF